MPGPETSQLATTRELSAKIHSEWACVALEEVGVKDSASQINNAIKSFTDVVELTLSRSAGSGYELTPVLANRDGSGAKLECSDVSNLEIAEFGGGLTSFMCLRVEDVRAAQLDKVALRFADLEDGKITFDCASATVKGVQIP